MAKISKRVVYITMESFDTQNANYLLTEKLIRYLLERGMCIHLIQTCENANKVNLPDSLIAKDRFSHDNVEMNAIDKNNFIKRYFSGLLFVLKAIKLLKQQVAYDYIYIQSYPVMVYLMLYIKLFVRKKVICSIYDVFPGSAFDIGVIRNKVVFSILQWLQRPCYKIPDIIIVLSEDMKRVVRGLGAGEEKIRIIPTWYDEDTVKVIPIEENRFFKEANMDASLFYVQYAGNVGHVFDYESLIEIAEKLRGYPNIIFQIICAGNAKEKVVKIVKQRGLNNIKFLPLQPADTVAYVYNAGTISIIPLKRGVIGNGVPSKAPLIMACGKVIINIVEDSCYSRIFKDNEIGFAFDHSEIDKAADQIVDLFMNPDKLVKIADAAQKYANENYSSGRCLKKFDELFDN